MTAAQPTSSANQGPQWAQGEASSLIERFREHLAGQKGRSYNTVRIYITDMYPFFRFLQDEGLDFRGLDRGEARRYLAWLSTSARGPRGGYARASLARKLVVLRAFYRFLVQSGEVASNPIAKGRSLRIKTEKRLPVFLGKEETVRLPTSSSGSALGNNSARVDVDEPPSGSRIVAVPRRSSCPSRPRSVNSIRAASPVLPNARRVSCPEAAA